VSLLLHTFDVPTKEPETIKELRYRHHRTGQYITVTFCPDTESWELQPKYEDNDRRLHYQQQQAYTTFLRDCALFMLIQADPGTATLSWGCVDDRVADLIFAYNHLLDARTEEEELTHDKMTDFAAFYLNQQRKKQKVGLLLDQLRACLSIY
jgi:hypothetical protein